MARQALAWILALTTLTTGCASLAPADPVSGGADDDEIRPPFPREGAVFNYTSERPPVLQVVVEGFENRTDAFGRARLTLVLSFTIRSGPSEQWSFTFEEALDPWTGIVVQQVARCGTWSRENGTHACYDERSKVLFGASGLPGGLAAAPLWGTSLPTDGSVRAQTRAGEVVDASTVWTVAPDGQGPCARIQPAAPVPAPAAAMTSFLVDASGSVVCDGIPLPRSFSSLGALTLIGAGSEWELRSWTPGSGPPLRPPQTEALPPIDPLPRRGWEAPLVVHDPDERTGFPVPEAHRIALERSEPYRRLVRDGGLVVHTHASIGGWTDLLVSTSGSRTYERVVTVLSEDGKGVRILVEKHAEWRQVGDINRSKVTYEVLEEQGLRVAGGPSRETLQREQVALEPALAIGRDRTGSREAMAGHGLWMGVPPHGWEGLDRMIRSQGYAVVSWHQDPVPNSDLLVIPYGFVLDGVTGAMLWFDTERDRLPF